jgi:hypothetical protein
MTFVFSVLITRPLAIQNYSKHDSNNYNSGKPPAINATSSAYASIKSCSDAIVYMYLLLLSTFKLLKYYIMYGYTLSKNKVNNSGEVPSPYLTPMFAKNLKTLSLLTSCNIPLESTYIFIII